jgi:hypothetical protein
MWSILDYWSYEVSHDSPQIDGKKQWKADVRRDPVTTSAIWKDETTRHNNIDLPITYRSCSTPNGTISE